MDIDNSDRHWNNVCQRLANGITVADNGIAHSHLIVFLGILMMFILAC